MSFANTEKMDILERFVEQYEYLYFLEVSGRLDAEWFELAGYED